MNEELKKLKRSTNLAKTKISFLKESVDDLYEAFKTVNTDLGAFIDVYNETQRRNEERFDRLEKHVGLD